MESAGINKEDHDSYIQPSQANGPMYVTVT
jgi:hypothetical protein